MVSSPAPPRASSVVPVGFLPGTMLSLPSSPSSVSAKSLPVIVSLPPLPCTETVGAGECVKAVVVTPARLIAFAPGPPCTTSDVRSAQFTATGAPLTWTAPATQVTVIASSASLVTVRSVPTSVGVTVALAMPGNASAAAAAAAASRAARGVETRSSRATSASSSGSRGLPGGRRPRRSYSGWWVLSGVVAGFRDLGFARVDTDRERRQGAPEAILAEGKSPEEIAAIARAMLEDGAGSVLVTRADDDARAALRSVAPDAEEDARARLAWVARDVPEACGLVTIVSGGTSDRPVVTEARVRAELLGHERRRPPGLRRRRAAPARAGDRGPRARGLRGGRRRSGRGARVGRRRAGRRAGDRRADEHRLRRRAGRHDAR